MRYVYEKGEVIVLKTKCVVNKILNLLNAKTGFIPTADMLDLEYRVYNLNVYVK